MLRFRVSSGLYHLLPAIGLLLLFPAAADLLSRLVLGDGMMPRPVSALAALVGAVCYSRFLVGRRR